MWSLILSFRCIFLIKLEFFLAEFAKKSVLMRYISEEEADFMLETVCHIDDLSNLNSPTVQEAKKNPSKYCLKVQIRLGLFLTIIPDSTRRWCPRKFIWRRDCAQTSWNGKWSDYSKNVHSNGNDNSNYSWKYARWVKQNPTLYIDTWDNYTENF